VVLALRLILDLAIWVTLPKQAVDVLASASLDAEDLL
jgi:hypothetical protein